MNPDYEYVLWDDADNRAFISSHFPWFLSIFDSYARNIQRADAVRYFYLYYYGGIYADLDFECLKPMDTLIAAHPSATVLLGAMSGDRAKHYEKRNMIPNAIMMSAPKDPFWLFVMYQLMQSYRNVAVEDATGPGMLYQAILLYRRYRIAPAQIKATLSDMPPNNSSSLKILDAKYLYPLSWIDNQNDRISALENSDFAALTQSSVKKYPDAYAVTYWTHTW
jgi:mannosyltransferase OCH1-like enzyme